MFETDNAPSDMISISTSASMGPLIPGVPPFDRKRVIIWYQKNCIACQNSKPVFEALAKYGMTADPPFTVHEVEATPELLSQFPHITVVPLYDVVEPALPGVSAGGPYGARNVLKSIKNDMKALGDAFPKFVLPTPSPPPTVIPDPVLTTPPVPSGDPLPATPATNNPTNTNTSGNTSAPVPLPGTA